MSRGPGVVEQAVAALFAAKNEHAYTVGELAKYAYRLGAARPTRVQRIAVLHAAHRAMERNNNGALGYHIVCEHDSSGRVSFRRADRDFYSPDALVEAARAVFDGTIDCDPASSAAANERIKATTFYTIYENGLTRPWRGTIWLNPPYSTWGPWAAKLVAEYDVGNVEAAIALAETRVTTARYFARLVAKSAAILKMKGRLKFWGPVAGAPDEGHELYYLGANAARFALHFGQFGTIFYPA